MFTSILQRLVACVALLFAMLVFIFLVTQLAPGDPAAYFVGDSANPALYEETRERFGLDQPPHERFGSYVTQTLQGNLGYSYSYSRPVLDVILLRVPNTILLGATAIIIAVVVGIPLGVYTAYRAGGIIDRIVSASVVIGFSIPVFWVGMIAIAVFAVGLGWFPPQGAGPGDTLANRLRYLAMPATTLSLTHLAVIVAVTRAKTLEMMHTDFFVAARAKGLTARRALTRHALRNALIPVITVIGYDFAQIMSGAILTETVFAWPGMGRLVHQAILSRDMPLVMGSFLVFTAAAVMINFLTDLTYSIFNPQIREARRSGS